MRAAVAREGEVRRVLVFEPDWGGHQEDWVRILTDPSALPANLMLYFAVHPNLAQRLAGGAQGLEERVVFLPMNEADSRHCQIRPLWLRSLARWRIAGRLARQVAADHVHFLFADTLQLPFAFGMDLGKGVGASGVLFRPSIHYRERGRPGGTAAERLRDLRKQVAYRLMLRNRSLECLLTLDGGFARFVKEHWRNGHKVIALPDPVVAQAPGPGFEGCDAVRARWKVPADRILFLLFGALQRRKGVLPLLRAIRSLKPELAARAAFLVVGRIDSEVRVDLEADAALSERYLGADGYLRIEDRFLELEELCELVFCCDVILAPYQRFVGSSGVINWAAIAAKPIIAQDYGLIGELVIRHGLGEAVDTTQPDRIARSIERGIEGRLAVDPARQAAFVEAHQPAAFREQLFAACDSDIEARGGRQW